MSTLPHPASESGRANRKIRSFVRRAGRITLAQERALDELWPRFGAATNTLAPFFAHPAPKTVEIGFGNGENLLALAVTEPSRDFLGIEVHRAGVGHLLLRAAEAGLDNMRVVCDDAVDVLEFGVPPGALDRLLILFPDPWHKARHHKRRLIQPSFAKLAASRLRIGGVLHLATDWQPYAEHMRSVLDAEPILRNLADADIGYVPRPDWRALTRFERRGHRLGHGVWDLAYERNAEACPNTVDDELYGQRPEHDAK
jgi:tRNA (guanine-N7-)-methyltransferase